MTITASTFEVQVLHVLPDGCEVMGVTGAGDVLGLWPAGSDQICLAWNGRVGQPFGSLVADRHGIGSFWSGDGRHLALVAQRGHVTKHQAPGTQIVVFRDGTEEGPFEGLSWSVPPTFSHDGAHLAYGVFDRDGEVVRLVLDGAPVVGEPLAPIQPAFSRDGTRLAYVELREQGKSFEYRIVLDNAPGPWFEGMRNARGSLQFSPDTRRFAFYRITGDGHAQWVLDDAGQLMFNDTRPFGLAQLRGVGVLDPPLNAAFSPDSRRFAYWADVLEKGVTVVEDGHPGPILHAAGEPVFSPDSRHLAYIGQGFDKRAGIVLDGVLGFTVRSSGGGVPAFSPDSNRVAMTIKTEEGGFLAKKHRFAVLADGELLGETEGRDVSQVPAWSPDSRELAWWVQLRDGSLSIRRDGREADRLVNVLADVAYTSAGRLVCAGQRTDGWSVFIDGRPGPMADAIILAQQPDRRPAEPVAVPVFSLSPDGEHVAWAGQFGGREHPVLDDAIGPAFDRLLGAEFGPDGVARWWAIEGRQVHAISATP